DGNNNILLLAWVVVSVENKDNWTWFLELIAKDLEMSQTEPALVGCGKFQDRILGPKPRKIPRRPRKKRFRASHETKSNTRISRAGIIIRCHNCWEIRHNKKGCKKEPIPAVLKEKKKAGRPKKIPNIKSVDDDNDVPPFVNNDINEFEMVFNVGRFGFNKKKKFGSSSIGHVKMRDGKTKGGRLFLA
ncbi:hypothetical protein Tco_0836632, partial [Tanacetum coccineum]